MLRESALQSAIAMRRPLVIPVFLVLTIFRLALAYTAQQNYDSRQNKRRQQDNRHNRRPTDATSFLLLVSGSVSTVAPVK